MQKSGLQILETEITTKCNLGCEHCYVGNKKDDMSLKMFKDIIDDCDDLKPHDLILTGGEPLLHTEFKEFLEYACKKDNYQRLGLLTTGLLIDESNLDDIKKFDIVQLSLDSINDQKNNVRKNYVKVLEEKIKLLKKIDVKIRIQCTIHKGNSAQIEDIIKFARGYNLQVGFNRMSPVGNARKIKEKMLTPEEFKHTLKKINSLQQKYDDVRSTDPLTLLVDEKKKKYITKKDFCGIKGGCIAGISACYIGVGGDVFPCALLRESCGNLKEKTLLDIWEKSDIFNELRDRSNLKGKCKNCEYRDGCGGCRASAWANNSNLLGEDSLCWF